MNPIRRRLELSFALLGGVALLAVVASGCGLGEIPATGANLEPKVEMLASSIEPGEGGDSAAESPGAAAEPGESRFGNVTGRILFEGTPPSLSFGNFTIAAGDVNVCKPDQIGNEDLVVGEPDGEGKRGIQYVFVWLTKAPTAKPPVAETAPADDAAPADAGAPAEGADPTATAEAAGGPKTFNNKNCRFVPHCMVVEAGETFLVTSEDATAHNTHTFPGAVGNQPVNTLVAKGQEIPSVYKKPEKQPVFVKCDLHAWMKAYHLVVADADYAAVTREDGTFELKGLPYGKHQLTIWHESGISTKATVTVDADDVTFEQSYGSGDFDLANLPPSRNLFVNVE